MKEVCLIVSSGITIRHSLQQSVLLCYVSIFRSEFIVKDILRLLFSDVPVMFSVLLTIPSMMGVLYLLVLQVVVLRIEYIWCTLMLSLQMLEFLFAAMFIATMCKGPTYD